MMIWWFIHNRLQLINQIGGLDDKMIICIQIKLYCESKDRKMFEKFLGKKEKGLGIFKIPEKKYCQEAKKIAKMDKKDLQQVIGDMEKYIGNIIEKLQAGKKQCQKYIEKADEINEKLTIVNGQIQKMNNQHQQLTVKFTNLQQSLEMMSQEKEDTLKAQLIFLQEHALCREKVKDLPKVLSIYKDQVCLCQKIGQQNKTLKAKYNQLQNQYYTLSNRFNEKKALELDSGTGETEATEQNNSEQKTHKNENEQIMLLKSALQGKEQIIVSMTKQVKSQKQTNEELLEKIQELQASLEKKVKDLSDNEEELQTSKDKLSEAQRVQEDYEKNIEQLRKDSTEFKERIQQNDKKLHEKQEQVLELKKHNQELSQEKKIIQQANQEHLQSVQQSLNRVLNECQNYKDELDKKQIEIENIKMKTQTYEDEINNLLKANTEITAKNNEIEALGQQIKQKQQKIQQLQDVIFKNEEEAKIKYRKYESQLNQKRIQMDSMKRNLNNLQNKSEENKKLLDEMYQKKMIQDGKAVHMEKKLKEYKHLIQYMKKQKIELERTFESKIKGFEEMVANDPEDSQQDNHKSEEPPETEIIKEDNYEYQAELGILNNKIVGMEEQLITCKYENEELKQRNIQLQQLTSEQQKNIRILQQKREEVMKEIKKMNKPNKEEKVKEEKGKDKKIAQKALRGFDIICKLNHQLYKDFLSVMMKQIEKEEIKGIETSINNIIKKTADMRDIFIDYI